METTNKMPQDELRSLMGLLIIILQAADVLQRKADVELHKYHREARRDVKKKVADALRLTKALARTFDDVADIAIRCGEVDGDRNPIVVFDAMQQDAGDALQLLMTYENARRYDETALVKLISYAKTMTTGEGFFSSETIADAAPR